MAIFASFLGLTNADSYMDVGCKDRKVNKQYKPMDYWTSQEDTCYNCLCLEQKQLVGFCIEERKKSLKKSFHHSTIFSKVMPKRGHATAKFFTDEEVFLTEEEATKFSCKPVPKPYFASNGEQIFPEIKLVNYYFRKLVQHCVRRSSIPINISDTCELQKVNECDYKVVKRRDNTKTCNRKYYILI